MNLRELKQAAASASLLSYSPYSKYRVGAAVYTDKGIFTGANMENASSNLGICAERVAIVNARMAGACNIQAIAVHCLDATKDADGKILASETMPCGGCRQWIAELAPSAIIVTNGTERQFTIAQLLPDAFTLPLNPSPFS